MTIPDPAAATTPTAVALEVPNRNWKNYFWTLTLATIAIDACFVLLWIVYGRLSMYAVVFLIWSPIQIIFLAYMVPAKFLLDDVGDGSPSITLEVIGMFGQSIRKFHVTSVEECKATAGCCDFNMNDFSTAFDGKVRVVSSGSECGSSNVFVTPVDPAEFVSKVNRLLGKNDDDDDEAV